MSTLFEQAFSMPLGAYNQAIDLYDQEIKIRPENFIAIYNRALCKIRKGKEEKNCAILTDSINELNEAFYIAAKQGINYEAAIINIHDAEDALKDLNCN